MTTKDIKTIQEGFEQDKRDYWAIREELLPKLKGKWVAVHKGKVVAVGDDMISIMDKALSEDGYAYVNKLGEEDKIIIKSRRDVSAPSNPTKLGYIALPDLAKGVYVEGSLAYVAKEL